MKNLKLATISRGLGLAVEIIIIVDFCKEIYTFLQPKVAKMMAHNDEEPCQPKNIEEVAVDEPEK